MIDSKGKQYLAAIRNNFPLINRNILEIGCGNGDMTRSFAEDAAHITAIDSDANKIHQAQAYVTPEHVKFLHSHNEEAINAYAPYDAAIYSLSLHHIPVWEMQKHLQETARRLSPGAPILVIEPGEGGSFMEIKKEFGAGSGDESPLCKAALDAMETLSGFTLTLRHSFSINFTFTDENDFYQSKLPNYNSLAKQKLNRLNSLLSSHRQANRIKLSAERWLYRLDPQN